MLSLPLIPDRFSRCRAQYPVDRIRCTRWLLACLQPLSSPRRLSVHDFTFEAGSSVGSASDLRRWRASGDEFSFYLDSLD
jgi:hypothetical protein